MTLRKILLSLAAQLFKLCPPERVGKREIPPEHPADNPHYQSSPKMRFTAATHHTISWKDRIYFVATILPSRSPPGRVQLQSLNHCRRNAHHTLTQCSGQKLLTIITFSDEGLSATKQLVSHTTGTRAQSNPSDATSSSSSFHSSSSSSSSSFLGLILRPPSSYPG